MALLAEGGRASSRLSINMALLTEGEALLAEGASHLLAGSINMALTALGNIETYWLLFRSCAIMTLRGVDMVFNRSLLASLPRKTLLAALVVLALAASGLAQDPTGRPDPKGKKPPVKKPAVKAEPVPITVTLTMRQREVLQLLAEGRSMKEVAAILDLTPRTVAFHKYRMMEQLRLKTSAELVQFAVRQGVVA